MQGHEFAKLVAEELLDRFISTFKTPSLVSKKTLYSNSFKNNTITTPSGLPGGGSGSSGNQVADKKSSPQPQNPPNLFGGVNSIDLNDLETSVDTSHRFDQMMNVEQLSVDDLEQDEFDFNNVNVDEKIFEAKLAEIYLELVYPIIEHCK
ncbi:predicted protein [Naegleria gruberi]|uniref:Predicted protein n=1 Tax=Naegleria gruberi TaxID=5762 RepID=D2V5H3_NAEGR|nr:uncharacterized protein NAEGRDRAFT_63822 [Naegleria gruberi]EFC47950.1 predicted protein [Naegleria gruberi]|eukprot:XP_002680694.1 predicted protein [Naegleria gruberi strain NEG-M]